MSKKPPVIVTLLNDVRAVIAAARSAAARSINMLQVLTNFEIGRLIVEHEQLGKRRAGYGLETLKQLADGLTSEYGRGFSVRNLENMRPFYLTWQDRVPKISQKPSAKLPGTANARKSQKPSGELADITIPDRAVITLENLYAKYAVTAQTIESQRDAAAAKLKGFLKELGYE